MELRQDAEMRQRRPIVHLSGEDVSWIGLVLTDISPLEVE